MLPKNLQNLSIYIHVPFCAVKCSYCAFNVYTHHEHLIPQYVDALIEEIKLVGGTNEQYQIHTIYFGGGTPTSLKPNQFEAILTALSTHFVLAPSVEISTEANPDDLLEHQYLADLLTLDIKRLSIGVQSVHQSELALFGRTHDTSTTLSAFQTARDAGFQNLNLDLIYGTPNQNMRMWQESLEFVLHLDPEHISLYALGIEPKTALEYWIRNGKVSNPVDDLTADMYDLASDILSKSNLQQYEISNWSKLGYESQHNLQYWRNEPYLGLGPGAHGYAGNIRYEVIRSPQRYIRALLSETPRKEKDYPFPLTPAVENHHSVNVEDEIAETIMMGLRLTKQGLNLRSFTQRFGADLLALRAEPIEYYRKQGMLEIEEHRLRLTERGRFVSNRILRDLI